MPAAYEVGDVVRFARDYADKGIAKREAVTVIGIDPAKNAVALEKANGQTVDWRPRQWGAGKSEAFTPGSVELMKGDRIEFTRNDRNLYPAKMVDARKSLRSMPKIRPPASGSTAANSRRSTSPNPPTSIYATAMSRPPTPHKAAPPSV